MTQNRRRTLGQRLVGGGGWALGGRVLGTLAMLGTDMLLARILGASEFGVYSLAFSFVMFGSMTGMMGANSASVRFIAERLSVNDRVGARRATVAGLLIGVSGLVLVGLSIAVLMPLLARNVFQKPALAGVPGLLIGGWTVFYGTSFLVGAMFRGYHDHARAGLFERSAYHLSMLAALGGLMLARTDNLTGVVAASCFIAAIVAGVALWSLGRTAGLWRKDSQIPIGSKDNDSVSVGEMLKVSLPMMTNGLTMRLLGLIGLWMVGAFRSAEELAVYSSIYRLVLLVSLPQMVVNSVIQPMIAELYRQRRFHDLESLLRGTATLVGIPTFMILVLFTVWAEPTVTILYGEQFAAAASLLSILSIGRMLGVLAGPVDFSLSMTGHHRLAMIVGLAVLAVAVVGSWSATSYFGAIGTAFAAAVVFASHRLILMLITKRQLGIWTSLTLRRSELSILYGRLCAPITSPISIEA